MKCKDVEERPVGVSTLDNIAGSKIKISIFKYNTGILAS
jgi:hypothetical protein